MSDLIRKSDVIQILKECYLDETLFEKEVFDKINNLPNLDLLNVDLISYNPKMNNVFIWRSPTDFCKSSPI